MPKNKSNKTRQTSETTATKPNAIQQNTQVSPIGEGPATGEDKFKLKTQEDIIRQNEGGAFAIGRSLSAINNAGLYKAAGYTAFKEYCKDRWGISDKYAYRLMKAAECIDSIKKHEPEGDWILPRNEAQIRELVDFDEKEWVPSWKKVMKKFAGKKFTAEDIRDLLNPEIKDSAEKSKPASGNSAETLKKKLDEIAGLVTKALEKAGAAETIPAMTYRELLEKIKKLIGVEKR